MEQKLDRLFSPEEIATTVERIAQEIDRDYQERSPIVIGILKGSVIFLSDLVRKMQTPIASIEFIRLSSYESSTVSSGQAKMLMGLSEAVVKDQDIILVEDIVDTGISTKTALKYLQQWQPSSLKLCSLLSKPERRKVAVTIDYLGLTIPDHFIVGYGLDLDQKYRQLPAIYKLSYE
ncbi:MAG: hypoxanthine phosphoribosyltransferase [Microcystaceae cyanobacterium]